MMEMVPRAPSSAVTVKWRLAGQALFITRQRTLNPVSTWWQAYVSSPAAHQPPRRPMSPWPRSLAAGCIVIVNNIWKLFETTSPESFDSDRIPSATSRCYASKHRGPRTQWQTLYSVLDFLRICVQLVKDSS